MVEKTKPAGGWSQIYDSIFEQSIIGIVLCDMDGAILECNPAFSRMLGYANDELSFKTIEQLTHPDDWVKEAAHLFQPALFSSFGYSAEKRFFHKDGRIIWTNIHSTTIRGTNNAPVFGFAIVEDITDRKLAEESLRESEDQYRSLFSEMTNGFALHEIIVDEAGKPCDYRFLDVNPAFEAITGLQRNDVIGKTARQVIPTLEPIWITRYGLVATTGVPVTFENHAEVLHKHFSVHAYSPKSGQFAVIFTDITERMRMENERIKNEKLDSLGHLAAGIAHDFNNLLTIILGNVSLAIADQKTPSTVNTLLTETEAAIQQARHLTHQLLTFAKGGSPIKETTNAGTLIRETAEFSLHGSTSKLELNIPSSLWKIKADIHQLSHAIRSLVINADQAMPGGGSINITAGNLLLEADSSIPLPPGHYIKISITDSGVGIAERHLNKIFDPYFTTKQNGSGMGLATTISIIKNHSGYITAKSRLGIGTTFDVYLPAINGIPSTPPPRKKTAFPLDKTRVLIMDDEEAIRNLTTRILTHNGCFVTTAATGEEALSAYKAAQSSHQPFDVVILDLTIRGGMGGKDTMQRLREIDPAVRAIVSSGYSTAPIMANYKKYGFHGIVPKPYQAETLIQAVAELVQANPAH